MIEPADFYIHVHVSLLHCMSDDNALSTPLPALCEPLYYFILLYLLIKQFTLIGSRVRLLCGSNDPTGQKALRIYRNTCKW